ncbi:MAG: hypothetical protein ACO1RX_20115 [Candidatus Sericytochromatia bacterium]
MSKLSELPPINEKANSLYKGLIERANQPLPEGYTPQALTDEDKAFLSRIEGLAPLIANQASAADILAHLEDQT